MKIDWCLCVYVEGVIFVIISVVIYFGFCKVICIVILLFNEWFKNVVCWMFSDDKRESIFFVVFIILKFLFYGDWLWLGKLILIILCVFLKWCFIVDKLLVLLNSLWISIS